MSALFIASIVALNIATATIQCDNAQQTEITTSKDAGKLIHFRDMDHIYIPSNCNDTIFAVQMNNTIQKTIPIPCSNNLAAYKTILSITANANGWISTTYLLDKSHYQFDAITDHNHTLHLFNELNEINKDTATKTFSSKTNTTLDVIPNHNTNGAIVYNSNGNINKQYNTNIYFILYIISHHYIEKLYILLMKFIINIIFIVCIFLVVIFIRCFYLKTYPIQTHAQKRNNAPGVTTLATTPIIQQQFSWYTYPSGMDKNNYIVYESMLYNLLGEKITCIHKYNIDTDTWSTFDGLNYVQSSTVFCSLINKGKLYLLKAKELTEIQLNTGNMIHHPLNTIMDYYSQLIIINNTLFQIGGSHSTSILKWDTNVNQFIFFSDMYCKKRLESFGMIYNAKNECLLLFGGYDPDKGKDGESVDSILEFSMNTRKWNKLAVRLPCKMEKVCCTWAINNTYVLLFGGHYRVTYGVDFVNINPNEFNRHIYIYSLKNRTIRQSYYNCLGCRHAITISKDEELVYAYIQNQCKFPPNELVKLIRSYLCRMEYVYLHRGDNGRKCSTLDIIYR